MDLRQLHHLIALAEEGRFARAAERVHLSHAAFSRSIKALETRLGVALFDRTPSGTHLTVAGETVLARARRLVFEDHCFERDVSLLRGGALGELSFGAGPIPAATLVPSLLVELRKAGAGVVIQMRGGNLTSLLDLLHAEAIDFFIADPRLMNPDTRLQTQPLVRMHGGLYCRSAHALARKGSVTRETLKQFGLGMVTASPALRAQIAGALGFGPSEPLPVALECDDLNTLVRLSRDTGLLVMLPHQLGLQVGRSLRCISVEGSTTPLVAEIHAIWLRGRSLSPLAVRAIEMATALAPDFSGAPG
jgi:DNA-binding transcriptional LysR family regulator